MIKDFELSELPSTRCNYYNVHSLLLVISNVDVDMPSFFRTNGIGASGVPAILVHVDRDIAFATTNTTSVGLQVHYDEHDDTLYFEHPWSSSLFPIKLAIKHLVQPVTHIYATKLYYKFTPIFAREHNLGRILRLIINLKLLQNNRALVHAGCIDLDGHGILVAAFGNTGKTRSTLSLCARSNYRYLSDDITLVNRDGTCFCFPSSTTITPRALHDFHLRLPTRDLIKYKFVASIYMMHPTALFHAHIKIPVEKILPPGKVIAKTKVHAITFLENGPDSIMEINKEEAISKLLVITQREIQWSTDPITSHYGYFNKVFDVGNLIEIQRGIIERVVNNADGCYVLRSKTNHSSHIERILNKSLSGPT